MSMTRIDRRGTVVVIFDDPSNHTHTYFDSIKSAVKARYDEFAAQVKEPFKVLLVFDEAHNCYNVMTKNPDSKYGKGYKPLRKKRPDVFVRDANNIEPLFDELGIEYIH